RQEVRVLTVHGSKGLEANVVFLPDTLSMPDKRLENSILWSENAALWPAEKSMEPEACRALREAMRRREHQEYRRLLYVAMTRARDRLYICGFEGKRERGEGCWYDLAYSAIEASGKAKEIKITGFDVPGLRMASPQEGEPEKAGEEGAADAKSLKPPPWAYRPPPEEPSPPRPLAPSRPSEEEPPVRAPLGQDNGARFKRGTLIHRLLQSLPDLEPEKRETAARRFLARPAHGLADEEQREIAAETLAVLEAPDFAPLFGPGSRAEVDLSGEVSGYVISARIDRLRITPEQVSVIDYKTNRAPPQTAEQTSTAYLKQMAAYRQALRLVYPGREVRCLLLWTDGPKLMELPNSLLDRHAP
ncbi:MAG TPA: double-strand break repair helicase AddA, partial [Rhodospirillales bacterium]|nr:double-strand break repair helicase AddA [Rhodospirillales bacterium]